MAVLKMLRIGICALKKDRKEILEIIQRRGMLEIEDIQANGSVFEKSDLAPLRASFSKNIDAAEKALETLTKEAPEKKPRNLSLEGKKRVPVEMYDTFSDKFKEVGRVVTHINWLSGEIAEGRAEILKLNAQLEAIEPWANLDVPMDITGTGTTAVFIGSFEGQTDLTCLQESLAQKAPGLGPVHIDIVSCTKQRTCVFALCKKQDEQAVSAALAACGFARPAMQLEGVPKELKADIHKNIDRLTAGITAYSKEIQGLANRRGDIEFMIDFFAMRTEKYEVIDRLLQSKHTFILGGYIPEQNALELERELTGKFTLAVEHTEPAEGEDVPVVLKNNKFSAPVEGILEAFSFPGRSEADPTAVMSVFYYVLFGLMLSDAAYGFLMALGCAIVLLKYRNIEPGLKKSLLMFFYCGLSTLAWGVMFGSYFGDAVDTISATFFSGRVTIPPLWFFPVNEPMRMLMFSLAMGIIHLFTGLGIQFYQLARAGKWKDALYDVVFWLALVSSLIVLLLSTQMFVDMAGLDSPLPQAAGQVASVVAALAAVGIIFTAGRESRNPFKRFLKGLYGLYGMTGYLSDILSYSRLLALGLATGVIASVINKMGSMSGGGVTGAIMFTAIFVLGHTMNLGINALGAYVHTNRLQYVEFFSKFYSGGGRKFNPFHIKTKYYKFTEEGKNG